MKKIVEIDDTLDDIIKSIIDDVETELKNHLESNPDTDECPDLYNDLDYSGAIHEIIDGAVPIYYKEIDDLFYLYGNEFEDAFDTAGLGDKNDESWPMGWKSAAIYCYLEQKVNEWWQSCAEEIFDEWKETQNEDADDDDEDAEVEE